MKIDTETQYEKISKRLFLRYEKETGSTWKSNFSGFCGWLSDCSTGWSKATFRLYKNALAGYLWIYGTVDMIDAVKEIPHKKTSKSISKTKAKRNTSQQKSKAISQSDFLCILKELSGKKSNYSDLLANWLFCGVLTGLRPIEWHSAKVIRNENGVFLIIENAKNSNQRANGDTRTLNLGSLEFEEVQKIEKHASLLSSMSIDKYQNTYEQCSNLLYRITRKIFPFRKTFPTLYSARHQFSANAKGSNLNLSEIAALMGHATDETATRHYGKKKSFQANTKVSPIKEEVETVRRKAKTNDYRQAQLPSFQEGDG